MDISVYREYIRENRKVWQKKKLLREIYCDFFRMIRDNLFDYPEGVVVEEGTGTGFIRNIIPSCIRADLFSIPENEVDIVDNIYTLSFNDNSVSNFILFDVFHHLEYPGAALDELYRALKRGGRVIIFDPCMSLLGFLVYGVFHREPLRFKDKIYWNMPENKKSSNFEYYSAQANASRIFFKRKYQDCLSKWNVIKREKLPAISYAASGGYSKIQLYPCRFLPFLKQIDRITGGMPSIFATRLLVVLEKK